MPPLAGLVATPTASLSRLTVTPTAVQPTTSRTTSALASGSRSANQPSQPTSLKQQRKSVTTAAVLTPAAVRPAAEVAEASAVPECSPNVAACAPPAPIDQPACSLPAATAAPAPASSTCGLDTQSVGGSTSWARRCRDQNFVTIKATTVVKDAAGAIDKILSRGVTALVTALQHGSTYDSLNQAVKTIAVARQYVKDKQGSGDAEVTFLPFNRLDSKERVDPSRFGFLVFRTPGLGEELKTADQTDLNVSRKSDINKMANAIISIMLDRGQAVMKAAGGEAIHVAMSAVVNARHRLIAKHNFDVMLAAAWITEDTVSTLGRESKFLRFNVLRTEPNGPKSTVAPVLPAEAL